MVFIDPSASRGLCSVVYSELENIIANKNKFDRTNSVNAGIVSLISMATSIFLIEFLFPQVLKAQDRLPPAENFGMYLHFLVGAYAVGSIYLTLFRTQGFWAQLSKSLTIGVIVVGFVFACISFSRIFHVRSLDLLWLFWVLIGYMAQSLLAGYFTKSKLVAIPSEKVSRLANRLNLHVVELASIGQKQFNTIVFDSGATHSAAWNHFLSRASLEGFRLIDVSQLYEERLGRVHYRDVSYIFRSAGDQNQQVYQPFKAFVEYILVLATMPLWLTVLLFAMLAVKLQDGGSVFFNQRRMGKFGKEFTMFKLRSMREVSDEPYQLTRSDDDRVTRVGRIIRKYRIDEIPQLFNVLRGEMALIGPRADVKSAEKFFDDLTIFHLRHLVRPGITGWAQVCQGYVATTEAIREKLEYDLYYVKHMGPVLDLLILVRTIGILFSGFGAR